MQDNDEWIIRAIDTIQFISHIYICVFICIYAFICYGSKGIIVCMIIFVCEFTAVMVLIHTIDSLAIIHQDKRIILAICIITLIASFIFECIVLGCVIKLGIAYIYQVLS